MTCKICGVIKNAWPRALRPRVVVRPLVLVLFILATHAFAQEHNDDHNRRPPVVEKKEPPKEKGSDDSGQESEPVTILLMPFRTLYGILPQFDRQ